MIRIDAVWHATTPLDMRAGTGTALARVVQVFGGAKPHHAYVFANRRATRMKMPVHDGIGVRLAARRLHQGRLVWPREVTLEQMPLTQPQLQALGLGLPWQRVEDDGAIRLL